MKQESTNTPPQNPQRPLALHPSSRIEIFHAPAQLRGASRDINMCKLNEAAAEGHVLDRKLTVILKNVLGMFLVLLTSLIEALNASQNRTMEMIPRQE